MDIWAFCRPCFRWFSAEADPDLDADCPVCRSAAVAYENRATTSGHPELLRVR